MKWVVNCPQIVKKVCEPKSFFIQDFTEDIIERFGATVEEAIELDQQVFPIYIESFGGEVYTLNYILNTMDVARKRGLKFATITNSYAMSCGADLFCYGDENLRFLGKEASLMFHSSSMGVEGKMKDVESNVDQVKKLGEVFYTKIDKHLKKKKGFMKSLVYKNLGGDVYVTAEEAAAMGLGTIGTPVFSLNVAVETKVEIFN